MVLLDQFPIWAVYVGTVGVALLVAEIGFRVGVRVRRRDPAALKGSMLSAVVGSLLGLLAFILAVSIGISLDQFNTRRQLVATEANAIGTAYLRAGFLDEPDKTTARELLAEYVDWRLAALQTEKLDEAIRRSEAIHNQLWSMIEQRATEHPDSVMLGLYVDAVNEVIDVHSLRVIADSSLRIPPLAWLVFGGTTVLSFFLVGIASSADGQRNLIGILLFALALAAVLLLLVDLDRVQEGLINVGQKALLDLQRQLAAPMP